MRLAAELTWGWQDDPDAPQAAACLHREITHVSGEYTELLANALRTLVPRGRILGLDRLFRRRTGGFKPVRQLIGSLAALPAEDDHADTLVCEIDAFAYGFLKGAKNLDLVLPCSKELNDGFRAVRDDWSRTSKALTEFERTGERLPQSCAVSADQYLALRRIIVRPSARDERRMLATLLVSGPSAQVELSTDLGISNDLSQRTLAPLIAIGVVELRADDRYAIVSSTLPLALFGLRETMGLELLGDLPGGV